MNIKQNLASALQSGHASVTAANKIPLASAPERSNSSMDSTCAPSGRRVATKVIENFFSPIRALASKPTFTVLTQANNTTRKAPVVVNVFYYIVNKEQSLSTSAINSLGQVLSRLFNRPVELRLVRLYYPYLNSYILAQYIAINSNRYNFTRIQRAIFVSLKAVKAKALQEAKTGNKPLLPAYITGMKIRVSGRLVTQRSVPRQSVQTAQIGSFSSFNAPAGRGEKRRNDNIIDYSSFTSKNKKGAYTVKVWISQIAS